MVGSHSVSCVSINLHHAIRIERQHDESQWRAELLNLTPEERRECVPYLVMTKRRREVHAALSAARKLDNLPHNGRLF